MTRARLASPCDADSLAEAHPSYDVAPPPMDQRTIRLRVAPSFGSAFARSVLRGALRIVVAAAGAVACVDGCAEGQATVNGTRVEEVFADPRTRALADAAGRGDTAEVGRLVRAGADPNARGREGAVPLSWAMARRNYVGMRALLAAGADPNAESAPGIKPLELATGSSDPELLRIMLGAKGDPNAKASAGESLLHVAVMQEQLDNLRRLVEHGADVNAQDRSGATAAVAAASIAQWELVVALLEAGADPTIPDMNGSTVANIMDDSRPPRDVDVRRAYDRARALLVARGIKFPAETPEQVRLRVSGPNNPIDAGRREQAAARPRTP